MKKTKILRILLSLSVGALALSATACDFDTIKGKIKDKAGNLIDKVENIIPKPEIHTHSFGEWTEYTDEGTACDKKLFFRTCSTCKDIEWEQGTADDHNWNTVTTAPTCKAQGYDTKTCSICGTVEIDNYTDKIDHIWNTVTTAPTCKAQGYDTKTCSICGIVEVDNYTDKIDHAWASDYSYDNSYHWIDCGTCDESKDKAEHILEDTGICSVCDNPIGATEGVVYEVLSNGTAQVVMYEGAAKKVRIAETYQGVAVTKIGNNAFKNSKITSIVIPDSVTSIGEYAFAYCDSLTSVVIPDSVTSIGYEAFYDCDSLTSVVIGDSVTSIGKYAFYYCRSLTSVVIGDSVTSIGDDAFSVCTSLTSITIPDSVTSIGYGAFCSCGSLTSVVIGDSVTSIGEYAFYYCDSLTSVYYKGTAEEWKTISGNNEISSSKLYYYSESEPVLNSAGTAYNGKFWKYGVNGEVVVWWYKPE